MDKIKPAVPPVALDLAQAYSQDGFKVWLVGGWVRDALLGEIHADLDFATDAPPQESFEVLKRWSGREPWTTGIQFGTVGASRDHTSVEVTTLRTEVYREESRNPQVTYTDDLSTDLSRRDFTINAIAITLPDLKLFDPFGGLRDLAGRRIRTPLEPEISFGDDPLRMLRAFRFASTLDFQVDRKVIQAISRMHSRLRIVSRERVNEEFTKLMLGRGPSRALELTVESGLADEFIPELPALMLEQDPVHRHKDVFRHTVAVLERVCATDAAEPDLALRLGAVFHDVGKPKTRKITPEGVTFYHHELVGADMTEARLRELRFPERTIAEVRELVALHMRFHTYRLGWTDRAVRRYVRDAGALLGKLNALVRADCTTRNPEKARELGRRMDELEARIRELAAREELSRLRPALDGHEVMEHLGIPPGPAIGEALNFLMDIRLDEGEISKEEAYRRLDQWWAGRRA
jgi:poly(A) polymerase